MRDETVMSEEERKIKEEIERRINTLPTYAAAEDVTPLAVRQWFEIVHKQIIGFEQALHDDGLAIRYGRDRFLIAFKKDEAGNSIIFSCTVKAEVKVYDRRRDELAHRISRNAEFVQLHFLKKLMYMRHWIDVNIGVSPRQLVCTFLRFSDVCDQVILIAKDEGFLNQIIFTTGQP